jgi:hypothetical protein
MTWCGWKQMHQLALSLEEQLEKKIVTAIHAIRHGSMEVVFHDSRIVQIKRKEEIRFDTESGKNHL